MLRPRRLRRALTWCPRCDCYHVAGIWDSADGPTIDCPVFGAVVYQARATPTDRPTIAPLPAGFRRRPARRPL